MRYLTALLIFAAAAPAQTADSTPVLEKLLAEVQQLRLAIERSTLLGARTQLAINQLQLQETRLAKVSADYNDARNLGARSAVERARLGEEIKGLEDRRSGPAGNTLQVRDDLDRELKQRKLDLDQF